MKFYILLFWSTSKTLIITTLYKLKYNLHKCVNMRETKKCLPKCPQGKSTVRLDNSSLYLAQYLNLLPGDISSRPYQKKYIFKIKKMEHIQKVKA